MQEEEVEEEGLQRRRSHGYAAAQGKLGIRAGGAARAVEEEEESFCPHTI